MVYGSVGEQFCDASFCPGFNFGWEQSALDTALNAVEQAKPVIQTWVLDSLPAFKPFLPLVENPLTTNPVGIDLAAGAVGFTTFPCDFGLS